MIDLVFIVRILQKRFQKYAQKIFANLRKVGKYDNIKRLSVTKEKNIISKINKY